MHVAAADDRAQSVPCRWRHPGIVLKLLFRQPSTITVSFDVVDVTVESVYTWELDNVLCFVCIRQAESRRPFLCPSRRAAARRLLVGGIPCAPLILYADPADAVQLLKADPVLHLAATPLRNMNWVISSTATQSAKPLL